jgi:hypothetical protein
MKKYKTLTLGDQPIVAYETECNWCMVRTAKFAYVQ